MGLDARWLGSGLGALLPALVFCLNTPALHSRVGREALIALLLNISIALWIDWAVANPGSMEGRFLNTRWMIAIGMLSYSLYLWQQPFLSLLYAQPSLYLSGAWRIFDYTAGKVRSDRGLLVSFLRSRGAANAASAVADQIPLFCAKGSRQGSRPSPAKICWM